MSLKQQNLDQRRKARQFDPLLRKARALHKQAEELKDLVRWKDKEIASLKESNDELLHKLRKFNPWEGRE